MADTDPPDKVDDGKAPACGNIDAPDSRASEEQVTDSGIEDAEQHRRHAENHEPENGCVFLQDDAANTIGHRAKVVTRTQQGRPYTLWRQYIDFLKLGHQSWAFSPDLRSGFGLRTAAI